MQDQIILSDHRIYIYIYIYILLYDGKYSKKKQLTSITQQQIVDVDIHIIHEPSGLIISYNKQSLSIHEQSKSVNIQTRK